MPTITFRRDANITSASIPVVDGQILFDTATHQLFMDSGSERYQYGGSVEIVSTTPAARADNVYSALASNQIFLQKTTIVDSKSNALAVTQQYIPLGCLAFKETIGTTNFSSVGSTVSSALVALGNRATTVEGKVSTIENELTANNRRIYMDYKNGKYGYNTSANRGADTFFPFSDPSKLAACLPKEFTISGYSSGTGAEAIGNSSMSVVAPADGYLTFNVATVTKDTSESGRGYWQFQCVKNGTVVAMNSKNGNTVQTVTFAENDVLSFGGAVNDLVRWANIIATQTWTWTFT